MTQMTVTDALAELTLLEKRINAARTTLEGNTLIAVVEVDQVPTGYKSREEHATQARASLQRVNDLISRRRTIKRAIVLSNASTMVTIAGEEMTVAEAIEMKNFISFHKTILATITANYTRTCQEFQKAQVRVKERLDKLAMEVLGKNISSEKYQSLADSFLEREGVELLDPLNLAEEIALQLSFVEEFESTCDRVLSISNARTTIEVSD